MALDTSGVIIGASIGLLSAVIGASLSHLLTARRDSTARKIAGLQDVRRELEKRRRLTLEIAQYVNKASSMYRPEARARKLFDTPGWRDAMLALQERSWVISCSAFLPEAESDFGELDGLIGDLLSEGDQSLIANNIHERVSVIEARIKRRLSELI